jgi:hypothetical protein
LHWYREVFVSSIYETAIFSVACAVVAVVIFLVFRFPVIDIYGLVLLGLSACLMMVGGAMGFIGPGTSRVVSTLLGTKDRIEPGDLTSAKHKGALYSTTGALLFLESLLLAMIFA